MSTQAWIILWVCYSCGVAFFAAHCVQWSHDLANGVTGVKQPGWWADALSTACVVFWPAAVLAGLALKINDARNAKKGNGES